ncbi:MAG TPA: DMT family transporter [Bryobacteraceae bacterium]|nr:DMT family transporter [Bryobacteraceae bacterium]
MNRRRAAEAALGWNTIIWGATFVLVKAALRGVSPILFLALRFTLATVALSAVLARKRRTGGSPGSRFAALGAGALAGTFLFAGYLFQTWGLQFTTAPRSAFITGLTSVAVPLLAALVYKSSPQVSEVAGVLVATAGLGLMTIESAIGPAGLGDLLTAVCAVCFAAYIVTLGHFAEQMSYELLSVAQVCAAAAWAVSMFWWAEKPHLEWRPTVVWAILITGILATALAFTIQAWAQQYTSSTRTALIYMLEPVVAWITSYCLVGEGLTRRAAAGAALIMGGVVLVEVKPLNLRQHLK